VLLFDADESRRRLAQIGLRQAGIDVVGAGSAEAARGELDERSFGAVVLVSAAGPRAFESAHRVSLAELGLASPARRAGWVVASPAGDTLAWLAAGADEVVGVPFEPAELLDALPRAAARREGAAGRGREPSRSPVSRAVLAAPSLVGTSEAMSSLLAKLKRLAPHAASVLLFGESGTGKELAARALHAWSHRADAAFVAVNAAAIPAGLFESALFGHARGAFTDAVRDRPGFFEEADGGTLFLDEVADLPLASQVKLLRVLEDQSIRRVGENEERRVNVRVVAATARDLEQEARQGRFRDDLLFRLGGLTLRLPPLRERKDDIPVLAAHFVEKINARLGTEIRKVSEAALDRLVHHPWPGNVRELENSLERAVVLCEGDVVEVRDLPEKLWPASFRAEAEEETATVATQGDGPLALKPALARTERELIRQALAESAGKRAMAARRLGISQRTLLYKLKEHGLTADEKGAPHPLPKRIS